MRRHVTRVMCFGRDVGVPTRRGQRQNRVIRIVKRVNDVVRRAWMVGVFLVNSERDRAGLRLQAITFVTRTHQTEQRQRIERRGVEIFRIRTIDLLHRGGVRDVTRAFFAVAVKHLDPVQIGALTFR